MGLSNVKNSEVDQFRRRAAEGVPSVEHALLVDLMAVAEQRRLLINNCEEIDISCQRKK